MNRILQTDSGFQHLKIYIFLFPVILFFIFLGIKLRLPGVYNLLIQEDFLIEYLQVVLYFFSAILSCFVCVKCFQNKLTLHGLLFGLLTTGLFFVFIEELSWGQRIFHLATPAYLELHNHQKEISVHNINFFQPLTHMAFILAGAYGAFAWIFAFLLPGRWKANDLHVVNFIVPNWFISSYFFFTFFIYLLLEYGSPPHPEGFLIWRDQEPAELLLSMGFFSFVLISYRKVCMLTIRLILPEMPCATGRSGPKAFRR